MKATNQKPNKKDLVFLVISPILFFFYQDRDFDYSFPAVSTVQQFLLLTSHPHLFLYLPQHSLSLHPTFSPLLPFPPHLPSGTHSDFYPWSWELWELAFSLSRSWKTHAGWEGVCPCLPPPLAVLPPSLLPRCDRALALLLALALSLFSTFLYTIYKLNCFISLMNDPLFSIKDNVHAKFKIPVF